jgi:hypothetical protein
MAVKTYSATRSAFKSPLSLHKWEISAIWPAAVSPENPDILFFVTTANLPVGEHNPIEVGLGGYQMNYRGIESRKGNTSLTFVENTDASVLKYFLEQYPNAAQDFATPESIALIGATQEDMVCPEVTMTMFREDGKSIALEYKLLNCYFNVSEAGTLGQDAEVLSPTVDVSYDNFVVRVGS